MFLSDFKLNQTMDGFQLWTISKSKFHQQKRLAWIWDKGPTEKQEEKAAKH